MALLIQAPCQLRFSAKNEWRMKGSRGRLVDFTTDSWEIPPREPGAAPSAGAPGQSGEGQSMLGKLAGAFIGKKVAGRNQGAKGAILGAGVAAVARRGFGPLAGALALGWGAKKLWEWRKGRSPKFPTEATPRLPASQTKSPS
jgi:hypothetical protein